MDKRFWLILSAVVAVLIGIFILTGGKSGSGRTEFSGDPAQLQADDHIFNPGASQENPGASQEVVLIEYGDFECPGCRALYPVLKQVEEEFADNVTFVFRHFPLTTIHQNAFAAHRAAEAAGRQGQFSAMHDLLYENQESWNGPSASDPAGIPIDQAASIFEQYASQLGLDMEQYKADYASEAVADAINRQVSSARQLGLTSTPSLLLNGQQIPTPSSLEDLQQTLQEAVDQTAGSSEEN